MRNRVLSFPSRALVVVLAALALLGACQSGPDLTRPKAKAFELLGVYGPKVSGLIGTHGELTKRLAALPAGTPGAAEVAQALEAQHATIAKLKAALDGYGATIDRAGKDGGQKAIEQAMNDLATQMKAGDEAKVALAAAGERVAALEAAVKAASAPAPVADVELALPGGATLTVPPAGVEQALAGFLADATKKVGAADDLGAWLALDRVTFAPDGDQPGGPAAKAQLDALAAILRAFPKAKAKVGGHAATGEAKADSLATARARAVMNALIAAGADEKRLAFEGRGTAHPACTTGDTDDCRAQNRRATLLVTAK